LRRWWRFATFKQAQRAFQRHQAFGMEPVDRAFVAPDRAILTTGVV
jgi:hypothetical protein